MFGEASVQLPGPFIVRDACFLVLGFSHSFHVPEIRAQSTVPVANGFFQNVTSPFQWIATVSLAEKKHHPSTQPSPPSICTQRTENQPTPVRGPHPCFYHPDSTAANLRKQPRCPSIGGRRRRLWDTETREYSSALEGKQMRAFAGQCTVLEKVLLGEVSHAPQNKGQLFSLRSGC